MSKRLNGYNGNGNGTGRKFQLGPNQRVLNVSPWHRFGIAAERYSDSGITLLRDERGRPVARDRPDLRPGEVSLVLR